jgi:Tfp pilus assembly protein PilX
MRKLRNEEGFVLVSAIILLTVIVGLGFGLLLFTDNQQKASSREQASELAFNVAEAALDAQIGQVSRAWPGKKALTPETGCTPATSGEPDCPSAESMNVPYPASSATCSNGVAPKDAWGSPSSNEWTTYVRDDAEKNGSYFNSALEKTQKGFDENGDNKLWVRAVAVVQCRLVSLVSLVARQEIAANFPRTMMSANWFQTGNNGFGHEVIVEGRDEEASQNGEVFMRCNGFTDVSQCEKYREGQLANAKVNPPPGAPSPTLSASALAAYRQAAEVENSYYPPGSCPSGLPSGRIVFVEGPCTVRGVKQEVGNSKEQPGFLVIVNGTFELAGQSEYFGIVYARNEQQSSGIVVRVGGNAHLIGEINVDGNGGIEVGENHLLNVIYNPRGAEELKVYAGATPTRNTFRVLSITE